MGAELVRLPGNQVYTATRAMFGTVDVIVVQYGGLYQRICLGSIERALPGIEKTPEWQRFIGSQEIIKISVDGATPISARVIPKADFFNAALSHPKCAAFRQEVSKILERLDNTGVVVGADVPQTALIKSLQSQLEIAIAQERHAKEIERHDKEIKATKELANQAFNLAETSLELQLGKGGRLKAIPELGRRGWRFESRQYGVIGGQLAAISQRIGDSDYNSPKVKMYWNGDMVNMYLPQAFDLWETEFGQRYPRRAKSGTISIGGT